MSLSDRNFDSRLSYGSKINPLVILLAIAMIFFVVLSFFRALTYVRMPPGTDVVSLFNQNILSWLALSNSSTALATRPWTILTHSFVHTNIWHLFASLIWLWCFGQVLIDLTGLKKIVPVFIYGTLVGGIVYLIASGIIGTAENGTQYFIGGGAAVLAVCAAATTISPHYKVLPMLGGGISLWILSVIYLVIDMSTLPTDVPALYIAHLGGAFSGWLFIALLRKGVDGSDWMNNLYDWMANLFKPENPEHRKTQMKSMLFYNSNSDPFAKTPKVTQQRLDAILDKINQQGFEQLSTEEKEFLSRASKEDMKGK